MVLIPSVNFKNIAKYFVFALLLFSFKSGLAQPCSSNILSADFDFIQNCNTKSIQFSNTSVINSGSIASVNWSFGDGGTSSISNPLHTYLSFGIYHVILSITD